MNFADTTDPVVARMLKKFPNLAEDYPLGVDFDIYGDPIFDIHAYKDANGKVYRVEIERMSGDSSSADMSKANKKAFGRSGDSPLIPEHLAETVAVHGDTWHHGLDMKTMLWMPYDLHEAVRHTGPDPVLKVARRRGLIDW